MAKGNLIAHGLLFIAAVGLTYVIAREVNASGEIMPGRLYYAGRLYSINERGVPVTGIGAGVRAIWYGLTSGSGRDISEGFQMFYAGIVEDPIGIVSIILIASWIIWQMYVLYRRRRVKNIAAS